MTKNFFDKISDFIKKIDPKSWPAFFMFVVVLAAAGALNYVGMSPTFGGFIAITVASFFGVGVLSWHIVESRTDDSEEQEQIALVAKWITVSLDALLLVVNFIRIEASINNGWDVTAYVIISLAAVVHVVGYLLWTQSDPNRAIRREMERSLSVIIRQGNKSQIVIKSTEKNLQVHKWVADEEKRLREEYADLEPGLVNHLVNKMRKDAYDKLAELETKQAEPQKPAQNAQNSQKPRSNFNVPANSVVYPAETPEVAEKPRNPTVPGR